MVPVWVFLTWSLQGLLREVGQCGTGSPRGTPAWGPDPRYHGRCGHRLHVETQVWQMNGEGTAVSVTQTQMPPMPSTRSLCLPMRKMGHTTRGSLLLWDQGSLRTWRAACVLEWRTG